MKHLFLAIFALCMGFQAIAMDLPMADVGKKRPAAEFQGTEQEAPAAKEERIETREERIQRVQAEKRSEAQKAVSQSKPALLTEYPDEIQERIRSFLNSAPGFGIEKLSNVAKNIRAVRLVSKADRDKVDNPEFVNALINDLAKKYTRGNVIKVVLALHTKSAADWLNKELLKVAYDQSDTNKFLLKDVTKELIEQLDQGHNDSALFLINSAKLPKKNIYLLNFSYKDDQENNLLIATARAGNLEIFNKILDQSRSYIDELNGDQHTALLEAINNNNTDIALALIQANASPFTQDENGQLIDSALLSASRANNTKVVEELLKNPEVRQQVNFANDWFPFTPLEYAAEYNNYPMFKLLVDIPNVNLTGNVLYKALAHNTQMVRDLIAHKITNVWEDVNGEIASDGKDTRPAFGVFARAENETPLVDDATARERLAMLGAILDVNLLEPEGVFPGQNKKKTLLMYAVQQAKAKTVQWLLESGANVGLKDTSGHDALWYAQQLESHNKDHIIKILQDAAARQEQAKKKQEEQK